MTGAVREIYSLETLAGGRTCVHRLHPTAKLLAALGFIVLVVSFDRYAVTRLLPFAFYPFVLMALSETPYRMVLKRFAVALPFCAMAGLSNLILDRSAAFALGAFTVTHGMLSLLSILLKTYLCVVTVLLLISTTPFSELTASMRALHVPAIFVTLFELVYRYIGTLLTEASAMHLAYMLRAGNKKGIELRHMGTFVGQLLLKSFDRSERVYEAMKCRGYGSGALAGRKRPFTAADCLFLALVLGLGGALRIADVTVLFNTVFGG